MAYTNLSYSGKANVWEITASVTEISASGNYRTIQLSVDVHAVDDYHYGRPGTYYVYCKEANCEVDGEHDIPGKTQTPFEFFNETFDVYVEPGASYANIDLSFELSFYSKTAGGDLYAYGSITKISDLSLVTDTSISGASNVYLGDYCKITWTPASASFYYDLTFSLGNWSYTTQDKICPGSTTSYSYTGYQIPLEVAAQIPNSKTGLMTVSIRAYERYHYWGGIYDNPIGSAATASFTVTVPDSTKPKITACNLSKTNSNNALAQWDVALVGYTKVNIAASAEGMYGSTIVGFTIDGDYKASVIGASLNYTGGIVTSSGNKQFLITCTDSRGMTSDVFTTDIVPFSPYSQPRINTLTVSKVSESSMKVSASWTFDSVAGKNSLSAVLYYKTTSSADWIEHPTKLATNEETSGELTLTGLDSSGESSYNFRVVVTDALGNKAAKESFASTTQVLLDFQAGGKGLGIGKICEIDNSKTESGSMEVAMDSYFFRNINLESSAQLVISEAMFGNKAPEEVFSGTLPVGLIYFKKV